MPAPRSGARPWIAAGALLLSLVFGRPGSAGAATRSFDVPAQAVVQVIARNAAISIRTWNRDTVQVTFPDGAGFDATEGTQETHASFMIPPVSVKEQNAPDGAVDATLLPEDFPVPKLAAGMHEVVRIAELPRAPESGPPPPERIVVLIPQTIGLVNIRSGHGAVTLANYHGTTIATVGRGRLIFNNVSGDAFVQPLNGHFYANSSTFDRLRIRSNRADVIFDACRASQIEVTTLTGNIIYDNGIFDPGLARFESDRGSIALGVNGGAQLGAHTVDGRVLTVLPALSPSPLIGGDAAGELEVAGNGGPLVSATSNHGDVLLYDGSLTERNPGDLGPPWHAMYDLLQTNRDWAHGKPFARPQRANRAPAAVQRFNDRRVPAGTAVPRW